MPRSPVHDLKGTAAISRMRRETDQPGYTTQNGCGDMGVMRMNACEERLFRLDVEKALAEAENAIGEGRTVDARSALSDMRARYGL